MRKIGIKIQAAWLGSIVAMGVMAWPGYGQFQTSQQVSRQVNNQVNNQVYNPNGVNQGSVLYSKQNATQNPMLPSEVRYEIVKSGLLPSQVRAGITAAGPLYPGGPAMAINAPSALEAAKGSPPPAPVAAMGAAPLMGTPNNSGSATPSPYAVNRQVGGQVNSQVNSQVNGQMVSTRVNGQVSPSLYQGSQVTGSVRYSQSGNYQQ